MLSHPLTAIPTPSTSARFQGSPKTHHPLVSATPTDSVRFSGAVNSSKSVDDLEPITYSKETSTYTLSGNIDLSKLTDRHLLHLEGASNNIEINHHATITGGTLETYADVNLKRNASIDSIDSGGSIEAFGYIKDLGHARRDITLRRFAMAKDLISEQGIIKIEGHLSGLAKAAGNITLKATGSANQLESDKTIFISGRGTSATAKENIEVSKKGVMGSIKAGGYAEIKGTVEKDMVLTDSGSPFVLLYKNATVDGKIIFPNKTEDDPGLVVLVDPDTEIDESLITNAKVINLSESTEVSEGDTVEYVFSKNYAEIKGAVEKDIILTDPKSPFVILHKDAVVGGKIRFSNKTKDNPGFVVLFDPDMKMDKTLIKNGQVISLKEFQALANKEAAQK